jgi:hypothetical protein
MESELNAVEIREFAALLEKAPLRLSSFEQVILWQSAELPPLRFS